MTLVAGTEIRTLGNALQRQYAGRLARRMRDATEAWQQSIGQGGLVPEAAMMEEMKPGGEIPVTEPPTIASVGGLVTLACQTLSFGAKLVILGLSVPLGRTAGGSSFRSSHDASKPGFLGVVGRFCRNFRNVYRCIDSAHRG